MGYWCPPQSSKLLETCVPGLVGSIPTQSRQYYFFVIRTILNIHSLFLHFKRILLKPRERYCLSSEPSNYHVWRFFIMRKGVRKHGQSWNPLIISSLVPNHQPVIITRAERSSCQFSGSDFIQIVPSDL